MQDESEKWLKVLGLARGASEQAIREAYRDLIKVWHPDRFGSDERLRQKAEERLRELNDAFAHLQNYRPADSFSRTPPPTANRSGTRAAWSPGETFRPLTISRRMAVTLSASAVAAAGAVWLVLLIARPSTSSAPAQPPAPEQDPPAATQREATPARSRVAPASRVVRPTDSPSAAMTGSLRVESQPTGARVSFDGEPIGDTPIVLTEVTPGEHQIGLDLESRGYKRWSSSVVVSAGREEKLLAVMTPVSARR